MGTLVPPCRDKTVRIAVSTVMDMLSKAFHGLDYVFVLKKWFDKNDFVDVYSMWEIGIASLHEHCPLETVS